jgi:hypothetical protein
MRTLLFLLLTFASGCTSHAQNTNPSVDNLPKAGNGGATTYAMPPGKRAVLKLPYAHNITVKAWNKAELEFKVSMIASKEELKDIHTLAVEDGKETLRIETDYRKNFNWEKYACCWCRSCDSLYKSGAPPIRYPNEKDCICFRVDYEILLPADAAISIETISGNIETRGLNGELNFKTISGFIDLDRKPNLAADLDFRTVTGEVYTNFDIPLDPKSSAYDVKVRTRLNGGGSEVTAETVSGDIFFRKQ